VNAVLEQIVTSQKVSDGSITLPLRHPDFPNSLVAVDPAEGALLQQIVSDLKPRVSLEIGLFATALSLVVGTLVGSVAGYLGGAVDTAIMRAADVFLSVPALFLILIVVALFGASLVNTALVIALVTWAPVARIVRSECLSLRGRDFVQAAHALGAGHARVLGRHVLVNALPVIVVQTSLLLGQTILIESGLSYLGLGAQPPLPSWGNMVVEGRQFLASAWWIATFPGLAIFVTVLGFNLFGDGLRDAFDPALYSESS